MILSLNNLFHRNKVKENYDSVCFRDKRLTNTETQVSLQFYYQCVVYIEKLGIGAQSTFIISHVMKYILMHIFSYQFLFSVDKTHLKIFIFLFSLSFLSGILHVKSWCTLIIFMYVDGVNKKGNLSFFWNKNKRSWHKKIQ